MDLAGGEERRRVAGQHDAVDDRPEADPAGPALDGLVGGLEQAPDRDGAQRRQLVGRVRRSRAAARARRPPLRPRRASAPRPSRRRASRTARSRTIARANSPSARGLTIRSQMLIPPADSPNTVTFAGIAAEPRDVVAHPLQRRDLVEQAVVARGALLGSSPRELGMREEAERPEPVVDGDDDRAQTREVRRRRTARATPNPLEKPPPWMKTMTGSAPASVLAASSPSVPAPCAEPGLRSGVQTLRYRQSSSVSPSVERTAEVHSRAAAGRTGRRRRTRARRPRLRRLRRPPAQLADRRRRVRDAEVDLQAVGVDARHQAARGLHHAGLSVARIVLRRTRPQAPASAARMTSATSRNVATAERLARPSAICWSVTASSQGYTERDRRSIAHGRLKQARSRRRHRGERRTGLSDIPRHVSVVWLRRDLRLADNPALGRGGRARRAVVPLAPLADDADAGDARTAARPAARPGGAARWWLARSLGGARRRPAAPWLARSSCVAARARPDGRRDRRRSVATEAGATRVVWARGIDPAQRAEDDAARARARGRRRRAGRRAVRRRCSSLPTPVETAQGGPYQVFTPFWRAVSAGLRPAGAAARAEGAGGARVRPPGRRLRLSSSVRRASRGARGSTACGSRARRAPAPASPGCSTTSSPPTPTTATAPTSRAARASRPTCTGASSRRARSGTPSPGASPRRASRPRRRSARRPWKEERRRPAAR